VHKLLDKLDNSRIPIISPGMSYEAIVDEFSKQKRRVHLRYKTIRNTGQNPRPVISICKSSLQSTRLASFQTCSLLPALWVMSRVQPRAGCPCHGRIAGIGVRVGLFTICESRSPHNPGLWDGTPLGFLKARPSRLNAISFRLSCAQRPTAESSREPQRAMAVNLAGNRLCFQ
jgi:hypothetical protein